VVQRRQAAATSVGLGTPLPVAHVVRIADGMRERRGLELLGPNVVSRLDLARYTLGTEIDLKY